MRHRLAWGAVAALALAGNAFAQGKSTSDGIAEYRKMLEDGNPAELYEAKGEDLWKKARGPKNASLEKCDLGLGPGVVKGAFVKLPRYFADTGRVQDLEDRLVTCMATLQGFDAAEIAKTPKWPTSPPWPPGLRPPRAACASNCRRGTPKSGACTSWASGPSFTRAGRTTSRAPPATRRTAPASDCRICPT